MTPDSPARPPLQLTADCASCVGLCCVALAFAKSADFAFTKHAGDPCVNLLDDNRCTIHPQLRDRGFKGCTVFDCFGAGQQVTQHTFAGQDWRDSGETASAMFAVFPIMRELHELLWYLTEASSILVDDALHDATANALSDTRDLVDAPPATVIATDVRSHRDAVNAILRRVSVVARSAALSGRRHSLPRRVKAGADLIGADLAGLDLDGADLRGSYLIAADLSGCTLRSADLIGADLRDTNLGGSDLSSALFLTQSQLNAAIGDAATVLPAGLARPSHWSAVERVTG
jgi:uncharacterized protein YjbI with pentapeptide repeats